MIPFRQGQEIPRTVVDIRDGSVGLQWSDQRDRLVFEVGKDERTKLRVLRGGKEILKSK